MDAFIGKVNNMIINPLISFLFALAVLYFIYGVVKFIANSDNEEAKTAGQQHMIWGIVGITIMMGVWTLLNLVLGTLGINYVRPEEGKVDTLPPIQ